MKHFILTLIATFALLTPTRAMTYTQACEQALFLTDKMAYELNLTEDQYEATYEINLDYLMGIDSASDIYSDCWRQRNLDLEYILYDWQFNAYRAAAYFFRPLSWRAGNWHFAVYSHYPRHTYYFSRPRCYATYRGAHSWRHNAGCSWYATRTHQYRPVHHQEHFVGMRDHRHDYRHTTRVPYRTNYRTGGRNDRRYSERTNYRPTERTDHRPDYNNSNERPANRPSYRNDNRTDRNDNRFQPRRSSTRQTVEHNVGSQRQPSFHQSAPSTRSSFRGSADHGRPAGRSVNSLAR